MTEISVVICNYKSESFIDLAIDSIVTRKKLEIVIVDNNETHTQRLHEICRARPYVRIIESLKNIGFARACNVGAKAAQSQYVAFLNPDARFLDQFSLDACCDFLDHHEEVAVVGGILVDSQNLPLPSARRFPTVRNKLNALRGSREQTEFYPVSDFQPFPKDPIITEWTPGAFFVVRRDVFIELGGFDERFFLYYEEVDFFKRILERSFKSFCLPNVRVLHDGGGSSELSQEQRFFEKQGRRIYIFQLMSEYLYFRKVHGLFSVLSIVVVEVFWLLGRIVKNLLLGRGFKREFIARMSCVFLALRRTSMGKIAPPVPW